MDNPNTRTSVRLRRHHTSSTTMPSTLRRRATVLQSRLPMKSNPYVGSFRHAPPATSTTSTTTTASNSTTASTTTEPSPRRRSSSCGSLAESFWTSQFHIPVTLPRKSSPYIGWFRHAPPSRFSCRQSHELLRWEDRCCSNNKWSLPPLTPPNKKNHDDFNLTDLLICGHLKGGGREEQDAFRPTHHHQYHHHHNQHLHQQQQVWLEAAAHGVVHALRVVARLASGLAYDADSHYLTEPTTNQADNNDNNDNDHKARHRHNRHHRTPPYHHHHQDDEDDDSSEDGSQSTRCDDGNGGDDDSTTTSSLSMPPVLELPTDLDLSGMMDLPADVMSVSSLAEAYYAHQAAKDLDLRSHCPYYYWGGTTTATTNNNASQQQQQQQGFYGHRLDYVITQSDIARMARNAARHLDVESIYNLPTTTYRSKKTQAATSTTTTTPAATTTKVEPLHKPPQHTTIGKDAMEGFSWLIIPEEEPSVDGQATTIVAENEQEDSSISVTQEKIVEEVDEDDDDEEEGKDVCVICFEQFCDGDRLRVLPCQHSFHMGCIDRWLSGSHSNLDCVTSGCPTCKRRPNHDEQQKNHNKDEEEQLSGSVPAWVFAQIGESLASAAAANTASASSHRESPSSTTTTSH